MKKFVVSLLSFMTVIFALADPADPKDPSTWKVTANDYQYSMTITTALVFNMEESRDVEDKIAAFVGEDCRGVASPITYVPQHDRYLAHLLVYSNNISGDEVTLYMWDKSTGNLVEVAEKVTFAANATYGSTDDPYLSITTFDVTFEVKAADQLVPGATVNLDGYDAQVSDDAGVVTFKHVTPGEIPYSVEASGYDLYSGTINLVDQDLAVVPQLTLTRSFYVSDGDKALPGALVALQGYGEKTTGADGKAVFDKITPAESLTFSVKLDKYDSVEGTIQATAGGDGEKSVQMALTTYNVDFYVTDAGVKVENASVELAGYGSKKTDVEGYVRFVEVLPAESIHFSITTPAYDFYEDEITVPDQDVSLEVDIDLTAFDVLFQVTDGRTPLANAAVEMENYGVQLTNVYGYVEFPEVILTEAQNYTISAPGYNSYSDNFPVVDQDVFIKKTLSLKTYNIMITTSDEQGPVAGTKVEVTENDANQITDFITSEMPSEIETRGNDTWKVQGDEVIQGQYAVQSGTIYDNQSTKLVLERFTRHGFVSFYAKVSSETDNDYLAFYIDGTEKGRWSGEKDWTLFTYEVEAGDHTFEWVYKKDGLKSNGEDQAWVDYIVTPAAEAIVHTATTNDSGLAEFYGLEPRGRVFYQLQSENHEYITDTIETLDQEQNLDIQLVPVFNLSFEVISDLASGRNPVAGVEIKLTGLDRSATTDYLGQVTFERVSISETIEFEAVAEGYETASGTTSILNGDNTEAITLNLVPVLEASNLVTPNGDGANDTWEIFGVERYKSFTVNIYSAAGELVYEATDYENNPWDGSASGRELPEGVYYYIIKNPDQSMIFKGVINLLN